jgi:hypothetical protein
MKARCSAIQVLGCVLAGVSLTSASAQNTAPADPSVTLAGVAVTARTNLPSTGLRISPWANEILRLAKAGIEERVMLSFIENSGTFNLGAEQIIQLSAAGVSGEVITAMLQHDTELASGARILTTTTSPPLDPTLERILLAVRNAPKETSPPPSDSSRPVPAANRESAEVEWPAFAPEAAPFLARSDPDRDSTRVEAATEFFNTSVPALKASAGAKLSGSYRVPETRPVELLPPIIVLNSASPPPNVIIIDMFPSSR